MEALIPKSLKYETCNKVPKTNKHSLLNVNFNKLFTPTLMVKVLSLVWGVNDVPFTLFK